jgi:ubiquinone/menaquinone biosynthesis C-methylase UbiE
MPRDFKPNSEPHPKSRIPNPQREGWEGWDEYAPFYDWENARTLGRRDVPFWIRLAERAAGRVLELGCGTGRVSLPLAAAGVDLVGIDRSSAMLKRARAEARLQGSPDVTFVRGDIRALPFRDRSFSAAIAPYGILQSLIRPRDLSATLASAARVLAPGATFGLELVPDVPNWKEYRNRVQLRGRAGSSHLTLIESVRQDRRRRLTTFEQCYVERRGARTREHRFDLTFRTLTVPEMSRQLERAGFEIASRHGDYDEGPWRAPADVWIIIAKRGQG